MCWRRVCVVICFAVCANLVAIHVRCSRSLIRCYFGRASPSSCVLDTPVLFGPTWSRTRLDMENPIYVVLRPQAARLLLLRHTFAFAVSIVSCWASMHISNSDPNIDNSSNLLQFIAIFPGVPPYQQTKRGAATFEQHPKHRLMSVLDAMRGTTNR